MKLKKVLLSVVTVIIFCIYVIGQTAVYAATETTGRSFGIIALMSQDPDFGYAIGDPKANGSDTTARVAARIWNIVEYKNGTDQYDNTQDIFCLREGVGFRNINDKATYNIYYDMKQEKEEVNQQIYSWNKDIDGVNQYNAILAILDMFYIKNQSSNDYKEELLAKAGIIKGQGFDESAYMTDTDVKAVQQAALWYFTNYGESTQGLYDKTSDTSSGWLNYTEDGENYKSLSDYNLETNEGRQRQIQAEMLYKYLIKTAKENASKYEEANTTTNVPAQVDKTRKLTCEDSQDGNNNVIGPIRINETSENSIPYTIDFVVKNGNSEISNYTLLDENKSNVASGKTVKDLVGKDFYIAIPKDTTISDLKIGINIKYNNTTLNLWTNSTNKDNQQPVVIPEKDEITIPTELTFTPEQPKALDLALRKYITKVNGVELTESNSRVPNIDETSLEAGTTATYKHKKSPVTVAKGDKVTYKLTVYNEGEKKGRATKIVDQLPTGLKFSRVISGNFELDTYNEDTNTLNLKRISNNETNLSAYTTGNLASETIEIECEVTAIPDTKNSKILTNVAWISEEVDGETGETITTETGKDRDSEPGTKPNVNKDNMENYTGNNNKDDLSDSDYYYKGQQDDDDFEKLVMLPESFDLKLIKRIVSINNQNVPERIERVDVSKLNTLDENGNTITTGDYTLNKEPVGVKTGDIVTYTFRIYNEGTIDGYAQEVTEDIPEGLEFIWSEKQGEELKSDTTLTDEEKEAIEFNQKYLWGNFVYDDNKEKIIKISSDYLSKENETTVGGNLIPAFGKNDGTKTENDISYKEVSVKLKVTSNATGTTIRNEACISEDCDEDGNPVDDRDSDTEDWKEHPNHEDDEDHDYIKLQTFDLALRKFIAAVSKDTTIEDKEYLKNEDGSYKRAPVVDTSKLNTTDENGKLITTATYNHTKEPVAVQPNDIVVYMLRVYNEGDIDGYASEIKDHLPSYLEFVEGEFNKKYGWEVLEDGKTVKTRYLENTKINKAETDENGKIVLTYKEVPIMCKVKENAKTGEKITNIADITEYLDENKKTATDRDSEKDNVKVPDDDKLPEYKDDETGEYIPGQEDDDDFEKVIIKTFDLALRKFIVAVSDDTTIDDNEYLKNSDGSYKREPVVDTSKLNTTDENGNLITTATYNHTKEPLLVKPKDTIVYMLRVYNEGEIDGYASEIKDHLPPYLEFVDGEFNEKYGWKLEDDGRTVTTRYLEDAKIDKVTTSTDGKITLSYKEVPIMCKLTEDVKPGEKITNIADIAEYLDENKESATDRDSEKNNVKVPDDNNLPGYKDDETGEYIPGQEDDDDFEKVIVKIFDLALRKWVTQAIVTDSNGQTVTETGHQPYDDPEQIVKVELHRKKLNEVVVKFRYSIRVINEGELEGYAKEITDYVPQGLKFVAEDNPGWTDEGNNVISTRLLENTLLQPGEYAGVEVVLTWINNENNMGVMTNTAEISEDYNEYGVPDKDSTPDNQKPGEDDIDDAPVMISVSTGQMRIYFTLGFIVLITMAGGVVLIKKYVL